LIFNGKKPSSDFDPLLVDAIVQVRVVALAAASVAGIAVIVDKRRYQNGKAKKKQKNGIRETRSPWCHP
jgi:hypothetical protein